MDNLWIWLVVSNPLNNVKVSWDDDIPNKRKNQIHVPNQPEPQLTSADKQVESQRGPIEHPIPILVPPNMCLFFLVECHEIQSQYIPMSTLL